MAGAARSSWIDIAKGLGIMLVVYGHVARGLFNAGLPLDPWWFRTLDQAVYAFHMPLFFMLSGYFFPASLQRRGPAGFIEGRLATVLYPYVLWSFLQGGIEVLMSRWTNGQLQAASLLALFWQPRAQFWFLYALLLMSLIGTLLCARRPRLGLIAMVALGLVMHAIYRGAWPFVVTMVMSYLMYFAFGACLGEWSAQRSAPVVAPDQRHQPTAAGTGTRAERWMSLAIIVFGAAALLARSVDATPPRLTAAFLALMACALTFRLSMALTAWRGLARVLVSIGQASMVIFLMHVLVASGVRILLVKGLNVTDPGLHQLVGMLIGVGLPWLVWSKASRWHMQGLFSMPERWRERWSSDARPEAGPMSVAPTK